MDYTREGKGGPGRVPAFGFSALGLSDQDILKQEFVVYEALYAECRRRVAASAKS